MKWNALASLFVSGAAVVAQTQSVLLPAAAVPSANGNSYDQVSWAALAPFPTGLRGQIVFGAANFAARGIGGPVLLQGMRLRAHDLGGAVTVPGATVSVGTSAVRHTQMTTSYANQIGLDFTTVFQGTIQVAEVLSIGAVGPMFVDIPFTTPFRYDPTAGDLLVELQYPFFSMTGNFPAAHNDMIVASGLEATAMVGSTVFPTALVLSRGAVQVMEFDYVPAPGAATVVAIGEGCPTRRAACFELFQSPFDLAGSPTNAHVLRFQRGGTGYAVSQTTGTFVTAGQSQIPLWDDSSMSVPLPFAFPYVAADGTLLQTNQIEVCDNGFLWLDAGQAGPPDGVPVAGPFCTGGPRIAAYWTNLDPSFGSVQAGLVGGDFVVTWDQLPEYGGSGIVRAQVVFHPNGDFDIVHGDFPAFLMMASLVGWSPGSALPAPSLDLSTALPLATAVDADPLRLSADSRPVIGTAMDLRLANVPASAALGAMVASLVQVNQPLGWLGMTGCTQYVGMDVVQLLLLPTNGVVASFGVPASAAFVGLPLHFQSALFASGFNPLGVIASNGLATTVGSN